MFRMLLLLSATMFATMLIGGEDRGQLRQGLMDAPVPARPEATRTPPEPSVIPVSLPPKAAPIKPLIVAAAPVAPPDVVKAPEPAPLPIAFVNTRSLNVREGPTTNDTVIGRLSEGEAVTVVYEQDGWMRIKLEGDGLEGFVAARLMTDKALNN
jgi:uncharacterized protein YgiM (DUF1202 family)